MKTVEWQTIDVINGEVRRTFGDRKLKVWLVLIVVLVIIFSLGWLYSRTFYTITRPTHWYESWDGSGPPVCRGLRQGPGSVPPGSEVQVTGRKLECTGQPINAVLVEVQTKHDGQEPIIVWIAEDALE